MATEAFNLAQDNEARVEATKLKLVAVLMTKSYDETHGAFLPFSVLPPSRRREIASLLKAAVDRLLAKYKVFAQIQLQGFSVIVTSDFTRYKSLRGLPIMTYALEGGRGIVEKWTRVLISCVIMYVTRGGGGQKIRNFHGRH